MKIGVLHPGAMGRSIASALQESGHHILWVSDERGQATKRRAAEFEDVGVLDRLVEQADHIVSICPPDAALDVAKRIASLHFEGIYVDMNAISPRTVQQISAVVGDRFVDGGIIGPPAKNHGTTRLYLSGASSAEVAKWFEHSILEAIDIGSDPGAASAIKMCYAAYTKGHGAMLLATRALAERLGVAESLNAEWALSQPGLEERVAGVARVVAPKAWRFAGEMREISTTFADADLPADFHRGAEEIYRRISALKDDPESELGDVLTAILKE